MARRSRSISLESAYDDDWVNMTEGYVFYYGDSNNIFERFKGEIGTFIDMSNGKPVLEICSGAGRVMIPMAKAGIEIYGLEASWPMISLAMENFSEYLTKDERKRAKLIQGDMCNFSFNRKFDLVIIPFKSFWYNFIRAQALSHTESIEKSERSAIILGLAKDCLRSVIDVLSSGGSFMIDSPLDQDIVDLSDDCWWRQLSFEFGFSYRFMNYKTEKPYPHQLLVGRVV